MITATTNLLPEMVHDRLSEGLRVVFDEDLISTSGSPQSRAGSRSSNGSGSDSGNRSRKVETHRGRHRSSSSSSSTTSLSTSSRPRSRSHPRCHRNSSRCCCDGHHRHANRNQRHRSPPRRSRARSRSYSPSPSHVGSYRRRSNKSHSRSNSRRHDGQRFSKSSFKSSRSKSSAISVTLEEKKELLRKAKENATKILGVEHVELPESVMPILEEKPMDSPLPEPQAWVRPERVPEKSPSQDVDLDDVYSLRVSPIRRIISFSINNSVAKPTVAPLTSGKVTPRVDSIESRKPYGHWVPVRRTSLAHKRTSLAHKHTTSR